MNDSIFLGIAVLFALSAGAHGRLWLRRGRADDKDLYVSVVQGVACLLAVLRYLGIVPCWGCA